MEGRWGKKTYPEDDSVFSLKYWDKLISADNFGLVQWTKSTQHLDIAFTVRIGHCENKICGLASKEIKRSLKNKNNSLIKKKSPCATFSPKAPARKLEPPDIATCKARLAGEAFGVWGCKILKEM